MRKTVMAIVLGGLFLLMLSALVVTPEDAAPSAPPVSRQYHAVFVLPVEPPAPVSAGLTVHKAQPGMTLTAADPVIPLDWRAQGAHDSNGRVLTAARYENSVYEVFRPEIAGG